MHTILIVDDHVMVGEGTKRLLLDEGGFSVDFVSEPNDALDLIHEKAYDLYIVDLNMPDINGIELTQSIKKIHDQAKVLIYTGYDTKVYVNRMIDVGIIGFLSKSYSNQQLIQAVKSAINDLAVLPIDWLMHLQRREQSIQSSDGKEATLTSVEHQLLLFVNKGYSNDDIAEEINVSRRTVERYLTTIFQKLRVSSRAEAIKRGKELGIIPDITL
ncbi:two component transcriptional regulator, LuxR family [Pelagirhabdus alkalitolerans]|uniref:Two component transcriptional regulator, LuxR family n=1 Tax=Pelagirhabdus alkalitolerans TaxID=1612202 RepID=A0A1G6KBJ5_9BACI|nr:response regulator transcription factor [Pelagirhabdus alkalitolerans]SDC28442.1 two component transcriptional regulator, LuxR family [Pelagirhabdus alkalitolerans]